MNWPTSNGTCAKSRSARSFLRSRKSFSSPNLLVRRALFSPKTLKALIFSRQYDLSFLCGWILALVSRSICLLLCGPSSPSSIQSKCLALSGIDCTASSVLRVQGFIRLLNLNYPTIFWKTFKCTRWFLNCRLRSACVSCFSKDPCQPRVICLPWTPEDVSSHIQSETWCPWTSPSSIFWYFVHVHRYSLILFGSQFSISIYSCLLCANLFCLRCELKSLNDLEYFVCSVFVHCLTYIKNLC